MSGQFFKRVPKAQRERIPTIAELVTKHGDSWALMAPLNSRLYASIVADLPHDRLEYLSHFREFEKGERCRCCSGWSCINRHPQEPQFFLKWDSVYSEAPFGLAEALESNQDDAELCAWLRAAQVGDEFRTGGATGESVLRRIA